VRVIVGVGVSDGVFVTEAVSVIVGVGVAMAVGTGVAVSLGVGTGESVGVSLAVVVCVGVRVGGTVSVTVAVDVIEAVPVTVAVDVGVNDIVGATVTVKLAVADAVTLGVTVSVNVGLGVWVPVRDGVGEVPGVNVAEGSPVDVGVDVAVGTAVAAGVAVSASVPVGVGESVRPGVGEAAEAARRATSASRSAAVIRPSPLTSAVAQVVGFASATISARRSLPFSSPLQSTSPGSAATAVAAQHLLATKPTTSTRIARGRTELWGTAHSCPRAMSLSRCIISILIRAPIHGVGVGVATRTTICASGPVLPSTSRSFAVTRESPVGKTAVVATKSQNCTVAPALISFGSPEASMNVQGAAAENC
jgi:hypothetical protein